MCCLSLDEPLNRWLQDYVARRRRGKDESNGLSSARTLQQLPPLQHYEKEKDLSHYCY